jgi:hypothetical protein
MDKGPGERYAKSLEATIESNYHYLKEKVKDFQEMCLLVTPERKNVPPDVILDIREMYKEIRSRLTEIKAIEQLLQGKYRQFYHRDPLRAKEVLEFGFIVKNCYSKFEFTMIQREVQKIAREKGAVPRVEMRGVPHQWFHSKENQATFIRNLRILDQLDYERPSDLKMGERREVSQNSPRSLTLFVFSGDAGLIDALQSRIQLREHDIMERYAREELHGLLAHLREVDALEVEKKFKAFIERQEFSKLKCLLFPVHSSKDLKTELLGLIKTTLQGMREGEVKTLSI